MSGIINQVGARSGVIAKRGDHGGFTAKKIYSGWDDGHNTTPSVWQTPTFNSHSEAIDTDYATIGGAGQGNNTGTSSHEDGNGTIYIVQPGLYRILLHVLTGGSDDTVRYQRIFINNSGVTYNHGVALGWYTFSHEWVQYLVAGDTIRIECYHGGGASPYTWHLESGGNYSLFNLYYLGF